MTYQIQVDDLLNRAEQDDAEAQYLLGLTYYAKNEIDTALVWLYKAAAQRIAEAQDFLLLINRSDHDTNFLMNAELLIQAETGETQAQYLLGLIYYEGKEVEKNSDLASKWLIQAAQKGNTQAQYLLGLIYYQKKEIDTALKWLDQSANSEVKAQYLLGLVYYQKTEIRTALKWLQQAAKQGVVEAQEFLVLFEHKPYDPLTIKLFLNAAFGDAQAQYLLGLRYYEGKNINKNLYFALKWLEKAATQELINVQPLISQIQTEYQQLPLDELSRMAENGDKQAQYLLGLRYYEGKEVKPDMAMAFEWLEQAMEQGVGEAQNLIVDISQKVVEQEVAEAQNLSDESSQERDYEQFSLSQLLMKAETGDAKAQYLLGLKYYQGQEVETEIETALLWFQQAEVQGIVEAQPFISEIQEAYQQLPLAELLVRAEKGEAQAQYLLGLRYYEGTEVEKNIQTALRWIEQAADHGIIEAQNLMVTLSQESDYEQLSLLFMKAETGDAKAQYLLGLKYYQGQEVEPDIDTALQWFQQAVEQGVIEAQPFISEIQKTYQQLSLDELSRMAEKGEAQAQYLLGLRYYEGDEVEKNLQTALGWLEQATEQGVIEAQNLILKIQQEPLTQLIFQATKGDAEAQYALGLKYYEGKDVEVDIDQALYWLSFATEQGLSEAQDLRLQIEYEQLCSGQFYYGTEPEQEAYPSQLNHDVQREKELCLFDKAVEGALRLEREVFPLQSNVFAEFRDKTDLDRYYERRFQLGMDFYQQAQYATAKPYFLEAARQGNAKAQFRLAHMYMNGEGVPQNTSEAEYWLRQARNN